MSYIPDCREDENYNTSKLNKKDRAEVAGYDWAIEETVDGFFDNLDYLDDTEIERFLNRELPDVDIQYTATHTLTGEDEERTVKTYGDYIRYKLLEWAEMARDEMIVSMIDGYDETTGG